MKKDKKYFLIPISIWALLVVVSIIVFSYGVSDKFGKEIPFGNLLFGAIGALFTGLAFAGTLSALVDQEKNSVKSSTLNVFLDVFQTILYDNYFTVAKNYIFGKFDSDYDRINKKYATELIDMDWLEKNKGKYWKEHKMIIKFCSTMEYIGVIVANDYMSKEVLFDYWHVFIIESYSKISKLFPNDRIIHYYPHFAYLYTQAKKEGSKNKFKKKILEWDNNLKVTK
jgi:hypothetical protein